jgi:hypothetical protein
LESSINETTRYFLAQGIEDIPGPLISLLSNFDGVALFRRWWVYTNNESVVDLEKNVKILQSLSIGCDRKKESRFLYLRSHRPQRYALNIEIIHACLNNDMKNQIKNGPLDEPTESPATW